MLCTPKSKNQHFFAFDVNIAMFFEGGRRAAQKTAKRFYQEPMFLFFVELKTLPRTMSQDIGPLAFMMPPRTMSQDIGPWPSWCRQGPCLKTLGLGCDVAKDHVSTHWALAVMTLRRTMSQDIGPWLSWCCQGPCQDSGAARQVYTKNLVLLHQGNIPQVSLTIIDMLETKHASATGFKFPHI